MVIQVMTTVAHSICTNCGGGISQGKGDLDSELRWWHTEGGSTRCPDAPVADPGENEVTPTPNLVIYHARWRLEINGSVHDWVARCENCNRAVARTYTRDGQQPTGDPVHVHAEMPERAADG
jgi:hypothetical protein